LNGIVGLSIVAGTRVGSVVSFNAEGSGAALATVATLTTLGLVLPTFTTSSPGPVFSPAQLAFAAITALAHGLFVALQTGRHRDYFLPVTADGVIINADEHATPPSTRKALTSVALLLVSLVTSWAMRSWSHRRSSASSWLSGFRYRSSG
jgi:Ca2+:H+ antiporter